MLVRGPMSTKIANLILLAGSCVASLVALELGVRLLDIPPRPLRPLPVSSYRLSDDPVIAYEYQPGHRAQNPGSDFSINNAGFRDYEYPEQKPPHTYRIVALGDSTTAGNGVANLDDIFVKRLEKLLNNQTNRSVNYEVLNMAVGGYHTLQEVETLRVKGLKYNPDLVLVTFCANDFNLHSDGGVYAALVANSETPQVGWYDNLLRLSRLAFFLHYRLAATSPTQNEPDSYETDILKGRTTVQAGLSLLSELQHQHGFAAIVAVLPVFVAPFDQYPADQIYREVMRSAAGLSGIAIIDLKNEFARIDNNAARFSFDGLHLNEYGHSKMADILLPIIQSEISHNKRQHAGPDLPR